MHETAASTTLRCTRDRLAYRRRPGLHRCGRHHRRSPTVTVEEHYRDHPRRGQADRHPRADPAGCGANSTAGRSAWRFAPGVSADATSFWSCLPATGQASTCQGDRRYRRPPIMLYSIAGPRGQTAADTMLRLAQIGSIAGIKEIRQPRARLADQGSPGRVLGLLGGDDPTTRQPGTEMGARQHRRAPTSLRPITDSWHGDVPATSSAIKIQFQLLPFWLQLFIANSRSGGP